MNATGGSDRSEPTPVRARPLRARVLAVVVTIVFCVGPVIGWIEAPAAVRAGFNAGQVITIILIVLVLLFLLWTLAGSSVRGDAEGITLRNGFRARRFAWDQVESILLPAGGAFGRLVLWEVHAEGPDHGDPVVVRMMGLTPSDGRRSVDALAGLRRLHAAAGGVEPGDPP